MASAATVRLPRTAGDCRASLRHAKRIRSSSQGSKGGPSNGDGCREGGAEVQRMVGLVATVAIAVEEFGPLIVTDEGEIEHVVSRGAPEQVSVTVPVNPPCGVTVRV